jgi:hypothetical protein
MIFIKKNDMYANTVGSQGSSLTKPYKRECVKKLEKSAILPVGTEK